MKKILLLLTIAVFFTAPSFALSQVHKHYTHHKHHKHLFRHRKNHKPVSGHHD
jgi:hypothetical protein